jgi:hypothetical protein
MVRSSGIEDFDLLLIDGDNLLHDVRGSRDEGGVAWLLPRLSGWRPDHLFIVVGLDGHQAPGESRRKRVTRGIEFHHAGNRSADDMLITLVQAQPFTGRGRTAVVTRDRGLQARAHRAGAATRSVDWLMKLVDSPAPAASKSTKGGKSTKPIKPVGIGQGKPPRRRHFDAPDPKEAEREAWQPGRGATTKTGNPKRSAKSSRQR